jgi:membrane fusion protein, multidrug efflux system
MKSLLFVSLVVLSACGGEKPSKPDAAGAPTAPVTVASRNTVVMDWPESYEATGTVRAKTPGAVSSKLMAYVQQVSAQVGDHVRAGQLLITLDTRDLDAAVSRAQAAEAPVRSAIPEADSGIAAAKASFDLAQTTFRRIEELAAKKSVSSQELDEASARVKAAQANYEMARSRRAQLDSRLAQVEQEIRSAGITRDYAKIAAPFAGVVTARNVEPGNLATPGVPLITIEREGEYRLEASVDESRLPLLKPGQVVEVTLDSIDRRLAARVSEVVPSVDAASRSYLVRIDLPPAANLRSGMFGRAQFALGAHKVTAIPGNALVERGQMQSVFVIEGGAAHLRLVTTGKRMPDAIEILSGLSGTEKLVAPVPAGLVDGARVEVRQ